MADIKFFHKILIVIAVLFGFWKLSKIKFPKRIIRTQSLRTPPRPIRSEPERIVRDYSRAPSVRCQPITPRPITVHYEDPRSESSDSSSRCTVTMSNEPEIVSSGNSVHIDDATFRRFYG